MKRLRGILRLVLCLGGLLGGHIAEQPAQAETTIFNWGWYGPCGWGSGPAFPTNIPPSLTNVIAISARVGHAMALTADGRVAAWGNNEYGQIDVPPALSNVVKIAAGAYSSLALTSEGSVIGWGSASQLPSAELSNVVDIKMGILHGLALKSDGTLTAFGGYNGSPGPPPAGATNIVQIGCSGGDNMAIRADGTVFVWGNVSDTYILPPDINGTNVVAFDGSALDLAVLTPQGTLRTWGRGDQPPFDSTPENATNLVAFSVWAWGGCSRVLALRADGSLVSWGNYLTSVPGNLPYTVAIATGQSDLALVDTDLGPPPAILGAPQSQAVAVGSDVTLFGFATGYGELEYQWFLNQTNMIPGATNSFLYFPQVQMNQSGTYHFSVSNSGGIRYSAAATLTVLPDLKVQMAPVLYLFGQIGQMYRIEYVNTIGIPGTWTEVATITLTNNPHLYVDLTAIGQPERFYRSIELE